MCKGLWAFISWLCFSDADWLNRQTPITWKEFPLLLLTIKLLYSGGAHRLTWHWVQNPPVPRGVHGRNWDRASVDGPWCWRNNKRRGTTLRSARRYWEFKHHGGTHQGKKGTCAKPSTTFKGSKFFPLQSPATKSLITDKDVTGYTPVHYSTRAGHSEVTTHAQTPPI